MLLVIGLASNKVGALVNAARVHLQKEVCGGTLKTGGVKSKVMAKKSNGVPVPNPLSPMDGRAIFDYQIGSLEGRLLTLLESFGLRESQENAAKDMLKGIVRTSLYGDTYYVYGDLLQPAIEESNKRQKEGWGVKAGSSQ